MKTLMDFLEERSFADFLKKAQNRSAGPLDYASDAKNPIVYKVSNSAGAKQVQKRNGGRTNYIQLKNVVQGKELKDALKQIAKTGFAFINGQRYAVFTGDQYMQGRVYNSGSRGTTLEGVDDEHESS